MPMALGQAGAGKVRPLVVGYLVGCPALCIAAGPRAAVVGGAHPYHKFHAGNLPLDEVRERFRARLGVERFDPIVLVGFSAGCQGVRLQLLEGYCPSAAIAIDGTHASLPPQEWQFEVWRQWFRKCGARFEGGQMVLAAQSPRRPIARVTATHIIPPNFMGTAATMEHVTGRVLPGRTTLESGNVRVDSYPGADADAHIHQGTVVLPAVVREVAAKLGMQPGKRAKVKPPTQGCPVPRTNGRLRGLAAGLTILAAGAGGLWLIRRREQRWRRRR